MFCGVIARARLISGLAHFQCGLPRMECELSMRSGEPDFEDGLVRACAELNEVDFIPTRDERAFRTSRVRALTCREYLELFPQ